jgi:transposase
MKSKNKYVMWYKIKELEKKGLNKSQISVQVGIDRGSVRKYLNMNEQEFQKWIQKPNHLPRKLNPYLKFVKSELTQFPFLSAAQIEDRLKEHFHELPDIHSKTVYNFVLMVRKKFGIEKPAKEQFRQCEKLEELPYGLQAQVDFGQCYMQNNDEKRIQVYFFCIVLCNSRYKYVYFQNQPFTAATAVYAHELAFEYFQGVPKEILYDQDKVFIHDENLGDYLLTHDFKAFCSTQSFTPVFCRKADPQSKGKVENVVKYVKYNFLRGRIYSGIDSLNQSACDWLKRTGNGKKHSATHKIPLQAWEEEKAYLLPLKNKAIQPMEMWQQYNVRKDNTVVYKSNFYTLPLGTYQGSETKILLEKKEQVLNFYSQAKELLASHQLSVNKGELIRNTDHQRNKSANLEQSQKEVLELLGNTEISIYYIDLLKADKPRYFHDNLRVIKANLISADKEMINKTVEICLENKIYNAYSFCEILEKQIKYQAKEQSFAVFNSPADQKKKEAKENNINITPQTSNINTYENILNYGTN